MAASPQKSIMRSLGEAVGHVVRGLRAQPGKTREVRRTVEEEDRGDVVLRRTTVEEIELKGRRSAKDTPCP